MVRIMIGAALLAAMSVVTPISAADSDACLAKGDRIGAFYVTKVAGADKDGVEAGQELCYRCRYGNRPMVMVFSRKSSDKLNQLISQLNDAVEANSSAELKGLVTLMGGDSDSLRKEAKKLASSTSVSNIPVTVANDIENGPKNYKLDPQADVTVVVASSSKVVATHAFNSDAIDVAAVLAEVKNAVK